MILEFVAAREALQEHLTEFPRVMIVHGRDPDRSEVRRMLKTFGLRKVVELARESTPGRTIMEKFERYARSVDAAVVLFTPDDIAAAVMSPEGRARRFKRANAVGRARQNVALEYGWFWAALGRDAILVLVKGNTMELPSDIHGLEYDRYDDSPAERRDRIREFIQGTRYRESRNEGEAS